MKGQTGYIVGRAKAPLYPDGSIGFYREILTADGQELIGREYPNEGYCWFNLTRAALRAGFSHDDIYEAQEAARDLIFNPAFVEAHRAELQGVRS